MLCISSYLNDLVDPFLPYRYPQWTHNGDLEHIFSDVGSFAQFMEDQINENMAG